MSALKVGARLRLATSRERNWWTVQAVSENFTAVVRQAPFEEKGTLEYSVLDWRNGIRGPCDLIGQGYGDGSYSPEECAQMLVEFEYDIETCPIAQAGIAAGTSWDSQPSLSVSRRNNVRLRILEVSDFETWLAICDRFPGTDFPLPSDTPTPEGVTA